MKKKIFMATAITVMAVSMVACGGSKSSGNKSSSKSEKTEDKQSGKKAPSLKAVEKALAECEDIVYLEDDKDDDYSFYFTENKYTDLKVVDIAYESETRMEYNFTVEGLEIDYKQFDAKGNVSFNLDEDTGKWELGYVDIEEAEGEFRKGYEFEMPDEDDLKQIIKEGVANRFNMNVDDVTLKNVKSIEYEEPKYDTLSKDICIDANLEADAGTVKGNYQYAIWYMYDEDEKEWKLKDSATCYSTELEYDIVGEWEGTTSDYTLDDGNMKLTITEANNDGIKGHLTINYNDGRVLDTDLGDDSRFDDSLIEIKADNVSVGERMYDLSYYFKINIENGQMYGDGTKLTKK